MSQVVDWAGVFILFCCGISFLAGGAFTASMLFSIDGILCEIRKFREMLKKEPTDD